MKMKKILLIDDDPELRALYSEILSLDYSIDLACDGEEGFAKTISQKFDLILLDLMMPKLDGVGFLQRKNKTKDIVDIPVVVMSNLGQDGVLKKCFDLGVKYYVLKVNTNPDKILSVIEQALKK
jgi:two-component system, response regulator, stage 0 sporulation protein A